jgi:prepilin-type processing-associated H-X9-DG protein
VAEGYLPTVEAMVCPALNGQGSGVSSNKDGQRTYYASWGGYYAVGIGMNSRLARYGSAYTLKLTEIKVSPTEVYLAMDTRFSGTSVDYNNCGSMLAYYKPRSDKKYGPDVRHGNSLNIVYVDGHAESKFSSHKFYGDYPDNVYVDVAYSGYHWAGTY